MSKYAALRDHLMALRTNRWDASFQAIEEVLGFSLPASARKHQAWWANQTTGGRTQCSGWMDAGWQTSNLNLASERITFERYGEGQSRADCTSFKPTKSSLDWDDVLSPENGDDQASVQFQFVWRRLDAVHLDYKGRIAFPRVPIGPAIYRFAISQGGRTDFYFGETDEISRRLQHYRTPGITQRTNHRLNGLILDCLQNGGNAVVSVISKCSARYNGKTIDMDLRDKHQRKLVEGAAIFAAQMANQNLLNQ